jgi:hypothetical protein
MGGSNSTKTIDGRPGLLVHPVPDGLQEFLDAVDAQGRPE